MTVEQQYSEAIANTIIKGLSKRNMQGFYARDKEEAVKTVLSLIPSKSSISWGGSVTMSELGLKDELKKRDYTLIDRAEGKTPEEVKAIMHQALSADYYIMSTNAITASGELINIDGNGNRVASLIYGPENVIIIAGINKIAQDLDSAYKRIKTVACPMNGIRLGNNVPCAINGVCGDCYSASSMCAQIVITRLSRVKNRIKVIIVGESLGY